MLFSVVSLKPVNCKISSLHQQVYENYTYFNNCDKKMHSVQLPRFLASKYVNKKNYKSFAIANFRNIAVNIS